jgi:hypothetical protein
MIVLGIMMLLIVLLPMVLIAVLFITHNDRFPDRRRNLCRKCKYDLRGGHDRCPECGTLCDMSVGPPDSQIVRRLEKMR